MLDHVALNVRDVAAAKAFYLKALEPLGYEVFLEIGHDVGLQSGGNPDFWLCQRGEPRPCTSPFAPTARPCDAFYEAAIAAGGKRQRRARPPPRLPRALLRGVRARPGRKQHRSRLPGAGVGGVPVRPAYQRLGTDLRNRGRKAPGRLEAAYRPRCLPGGQAG